MWTESIQKYLASNCMKISNQYSLQNVLFCAPPKNKKKCCGFGMKANAWWQNCIFGGWIIPLITTLFSWAVSRMMWLRKLNHTWFTFFSFSSLEHENQRATLTFVYVSKLRKNYRVCMAYMTSACQCLPFFLQTLSWGLVGRWGGFLTWRLPSVGG